MARSKIKPQFTTATRNSSKSADQTRTGVSIGGGGRSGGSGPFTFRRGASERNNTIDVRFNALTYPEFGNAADGGHAIVFKINRAVPVATQGKSLKEFIPEALKKTSEASVSANQNSTLSKTQLFAGGPKSKFLSAGPAGQNTITRTSAGRSLQFDTPKKRLDTAIVLYMPPQIQTTYGMNYSDVDMGFASQAMVGVFDAMGGKTADMTEEKVTAFVKKAALASLNTAAPGATAGLQIRMGAIISNKMELSFTGVNRREFQFVFNFTPKSEKEANTIRDIITTFKYYAHPAFLEGSGGNMMTIPDSFDIEYRSHGAHNQYLHKISTCFCSSINVQYGGDRFTAHKQNDRGAPPSKTILSLNFKEMELITKSRIDQGY